MYRQIHVSATMSSVPFYFDPHCRFTSANPSSSLPHFSLTSSSPIRSASYGLCCALCTEQRHLSNNLRCQDRKLNDSVIDSIISKCLGAVDHFTSPPPAHVSLRSDELALDRPGIGFGYGKACASIEKELPRENLSSFKHGNATNFKYGVTGHNLKAKRENLIQEVEFKHEDLSDRNDMFSKASTTPLQLPIVMSMTDMNSYFHDNKNIDSKLQTGIVIPKNATTTSLPISDIETDSSIYEFSPYTSGPQRPFPTSHLDQHDNHSRSPTFTSIASEANGPSDNGRVRKKSKRMQRARARPWSTDEQRRFEESLELYGRNWEQCAMYIGTRRTSLVRSHAQKHLIKLWKLGKPLPKKVAETGAGYTLSGKPLLPESASAKSYLLRLPCPDKALS